MLKAANLSYNVCMLDTLSLTCAAWYCHCRRRQELPLTLAGGSQPVKWVGVTADGKALKPHNHTEQQYKQLLPLMFEGSNHSKSSIRFLVVIGITSIHEGSRGPQGSSPA